MSEPQDTNFESVITNTNKHTEGPVEDTRLLHPPSETRPESTSPNSGVRKPPFMYRPFFSALNQQPGSDTVQHDKAAESTLMENQIIRPGELEDTSYSMERVEDSEDTQDSGSSIVPVDIDGEVMAIDQDFVVEDETLNEEDIVNDDETLNEEEVMNEADNVNEYEMIVETADEDDMTPVAVDDSLPDDEIAMEGDTAFGGEGNLRNDEEQSVEETAQNYKNEIIEETAQTALNDNELLKETAEVEEESKNVEEISDDECSLNEEQNVNEGEMNMEDDNAVEEFETAAVEDETLHEKTMNEAENVNEYKMIVEADDAADEFETTAVVEDSLAAQQMTLEGNTAPDGENVEEIDEQIDEEIMKENAAGEEELKDVGESEEIVEDGVQTLEDDGDEEIVEDEVKTLEDDVIEDGENAKEIDEDNAEEKEETINVEENESLEALEAEQNANGKENPEQDSDDEIRADTEDHSSEESEENGPMDADNMMDENASAIAEDVPSEVDTAAEDLEEANNEDSDEVGSEINEKNPSEANGQEDECSAINENPTNEDQDQEIYLDVPDDELEELHVDENKAASPDDNITQDEDAPMKNDEGQSGGAGETIEESEPPETVDAVEAPEAEPAVQESHGVGETIEESEPPETVDAAEAQEAEPAVQESHDSEPLETAEAIEAPETVGTAVQESHDLDGATLEAGDKDQIPEESSDSAGDIQTEKATPVTDVDNNDEETPMECDTSEDTAADGDPNDMLPDLVTESTTAAETSTTADQSAFDQATVLGTVTMETNNTKSAKTSETSPEDAIKQETVTDDETKDGPAESSQQSDPLLAEIVSSIMDNAKKEEDDCPLEKIPDPTPVKQAPPPRRRPSQEDAIRLTRADLFVKPVVRVSRVKADSYLSGDSSTDTEASPKRRRTYAPPPEVSPSRDIIKCEFCPKTYTSKDGHRRHMHALHTEHVAPKKAPRPPDPRKCPKCGIKFANVANATRHLKTVHNNDKPDSKVISKSKSNTNVTPKMKNSIKSKTVEETNDVIVVDSTTEITICYKCHKEFANITSLRKHFYNSHKNLYRAVVHLKQICNRCGKRFSGMKSLSHHRIYCIALVSVKVSCESCDKFFKSKEALANHTKDAHPKVEEENQCKCGKVYMKKGNLTSHMMMCAIAKASKSKSSQSRLPKENTSDKEKEIVQKKESNLKKEIDKKALDDKINCCFKCKRQFPNFDLLHQHVTTVHKIKSFPKTPFPTEQPPKARDTRSSKDFTARLTVAEKLENARASLLLKQAKLARRTTQVKKVSSTESNTINCPACNLYFYNRYSLDSHFRRAHGEENMPHQCHVCSKGFFAKESLENHMKSAHNRTTQDGGYHAKKESQNKCPHCSKNFPKVDALEAHITKMHTKKDLPFRCPLCDERFALPTELVDHYQDDHGAPAKKQKLSDSSSAAVLSPSPSAHKCHCCNKGFNTLDDLEGHIRKDHGQDKLPHQCPVCQTGFYSYSRMTDHQQKTHGGADQDEDEGMYMCKYCSKMYMNSDAYEKHIVRMHGDDKLPHRCPICCRGFLQFSGLEAHISSHGSSNSKPQSTTVTEEPAKRTPEPEPAPELSKPTPEAPTPKAADIQKSVSCAVQSTYLKKCMLCMRTFANSDQCGRHIRGEHGDQYLPHKCEKCGKGFIKKTSLQHHRCGPTSSPAKPTVSKEPSPKATNVKEIKIQEAAVKKSIAPSPSKIITDCPVCSKSYKTTASLERHIMDAHGVGHMPYKCSFCPREYYCKERHENHMANYCTNKKASSQVEEDDRAVEYQCSLCGKAFRHASTLERHVSDVHRNDSPAAPSPKPSSQASNSSQQSDDLQCCICTEQFQNSSSLAKHITVQHGLNQLPYSCKKCTKRFALQSSLDIHNTFVHKDQDEIQRLATKSTENNEKPSLSCSVCDKTFTKLINVEMHTRKKHPEFQLPATCPMCQLGFLTMPRLENHHISVHGCPINSEVSISVENGRSSSRKLPFACSACPKRFTEKSSLDNHVQYIHGSDDELEIVEVVQSATVIEAPANVAKEPANIAEEPSNEDTEPTNWNCSECGYLFKQASSLQRHMMQKHPNAKFPYHCDSCSMGFVTSKRLTNHYKVCDTTITYMPQISDDSNSVDAPQGSSGTMFTGISSLWMECDDGSDNDTPLKTLTARSKKQSAKKKRPSSKMSHFQNSPLSVRDEDSNPGPSSGFLNNLLEACGTIANESG